MKSCNVLLTTTYLHLYPFRFSKKSNVYLKTFKFPFDYGTKNYIITYKLQMYIL